MASAAAVLAVCVALLAISAGAVQLPKPQTPMTQNDNPFYAAQNSTLSGPSRGFLYGTNDLAVDDPAFAHPANPDTPDQVKLTLVSPSEVWVTFTTGSPSNGTYANGTAAPAAPLLPYKKPSTVYYGHRRGRYSYSVNAGTPRNYVQTATVKGVNIYYISPFLYRAKLQDLDPDTEYFYYIVNTASPSAPPTQKFSFKTLRPVGDDTTFKIAVIGDIGQTPNTTDTLKHMKGNKPDTIYNMGDLTYADNFPNNDGNKWDNWGRLVQPYFSGVPHNPTNGNHELETGQGNNQGTKQVQYNARYPMPYDESDSDSNLYYSIEHGPVHTLFLSQYTDYSKASAQYAWAKADLESIDRSKTPWVFVVFHGPVYHTYVVHYKQYDCFRQVWEPLFNEKGVDLALSGHVHAYERSNPVNNYTADATGCAPTYLTVGDGGNSERLYHNYVDGTANDGLGAAAGGVDGCPTPVDNDVAADPQTCYSTKLQVPYCTPTQPEWSAYREDAFGHGILEIQDATHAKWSWYRNLDTLPVVTDSMVLQRDTAACANRREGRVKAPLPNSGKPTRKHGHGHGYGNK